MATIGKTRSTERTEFLNNVLVDAIEGYVTGQWALIRQIERGDDLNIVSVVVRDESNPATADGPKDYVVTIETIAKGFACLKANPGHLGQPHRLLLANRTNSAEGDYDAVDADAVLQLGLFGEVVFG